MQGIPALLISLLTIADGDALLIEAANTREVREFYIKTVHLDGQAITKGDADHKPEPSPTRQRPMAKDSF